MNSGSDVANSPSQSSPLEDARHNVRVLTVAALRPNLTPEQRAVYRSLELSARAEVALRLKHQGGQP